MEDKYGFRMIMEDSKLREFVETNFLEEKNSNPVIVKVVKRIMRLLDKCNDLNVRSQKWSNPPVRARITVDPLLDRLKKAVEVTLERLESWLPNYNWRDGYVRELRYEMKIAFDKFIVVRKKYSELTETSRGNKRSEFIKAYIARDILDYVKYSINILLANFSANYLSARLRIGMIEIHFEMLRRELEGLDVGNEKEVTRFGEDVSLHKQFMLDLADYFTRYSESELKKFNSKAYLMLRKKEGVGIEDVIQRKMDELKYTDPFYYLEDSEQDKVYQGILDEFDGQNTSNLIFIATKN